MSTVGLVTNVHLTRRHPVSLVHFVTRRCNARCSFCFIDFDHPDPVSSELTVDEIDRLTRTVGPHLQNVNITGGEPFLRGDMLDIARSYYDNTGIRSIYITTNGALTSRIVPFAKAVAEEYPDRKLIISLSVDSFPEEHDRIRKINGLFDKVMHTYHALNDLGGPVMANVAITVSHENHAIVPALYEDLITRHGVQAITAIIVRDEGVYAVPADHKVAILDAYRQLTGNIKRDLRSGRLGGYDASSLQGRLMNRKNDLMFDIVADTYTDPHYISPCHAGRLFGIVDVDGTVYPCEVLDRPLGNLRDYDMDFGRLWRDRAAREATAWIRDTNCNCTYECAWSFNILGNLRYQPSLIGAALGR